MKLNDFQRKINRRSSIYCGLVQDMDYIGLLPAGVAEKLLAGDIEGAKAANSSPATSPSPPSGTS